jgi:hypothetical protein
VSRECVNLAGEWNWLTADEGEDRYDTNATPPSSRYFPGVVSGVLRLLP